MSDATAGTGTNTDGGTGKARAVLVPRPAFADIDIEAIEPTLDRHLAHCRATIAAIVARHAPDGEAPTWESLVQPQAEAHNALHLFWSPVSHLNSVMHTDALREVHARCLPKLTAYWTGLGQNVELYNATMALKSSAAFDALDAARRREIDNDLRDFELGGVSLDADGKRRFGEIADSSSTLSTRFTDNVLDATKAWEKLLTDADELDGLPPSALRAAQARAQASGREGYLLNLEFPTYHAIMTFSKRRALREEMYVAWSTRASDRGPDAGRFDNSSVMRELLELRAEQARLLGHESYAHRSMVTKMVDSPEQVLAFLDDLVERGLPVARAERETLEAFARRSPEEGGLGVDSFAAWDVPFASDRLKRHLHELSDEDLKPYFDASRVIPAMFGIVGRLFGLGFGKVDGADVYHPDVELYAVTDADGELRGEFYLDLYARPDKRGGAWMDVCATRQRVGDALQAPIAYLVGNLTPPLDGAPALLTHQDVTTLFHEFGHGLHHLLTRVDAAGVSGINGVEWDAVELPSQFLENWCWERESLDLLGAHHESGEPIPEALVERLRATRHFQAGMALMRQLEFALFDLRLHLDSRPGAAADVQVTLDAVRARAAVLEVPESNRFQHGFSHIFAGGYAAGYFSYKWAEVLSADAFSRFEEEGLFDACAGADFRREILERGGSRDAMSSYVAFRGREPSVDALLRQSGLSAA